MLDHPIPEIPRKSIERNAIKYNQYPLKIHKSLYSIPLIIAISTFLVRLIYDYILIYSIINNIRQNIGCFTPKHGDVLPHYIRMF